MYLADRIYLTPVLDRAVVLDLKRDKYMALGPGLARAALDLTGDTPPPPRELVELSAARGALMQRGILAEHPAPIQTRSHPPPPVARATLWPSETGRTQTRLSAVLAVQWALAQAWLALRFLPFDRTIAWMRAQPVRAQVREPVQRLVDDYFTARPWFPAKPICRLDALALCLHLRRNGQPATLVFGVKLEPFAAHCWVQRGDQVLNEPHEVVLQYSSILIV